MCYKKFEIVAQTEEDQSVDSEILAVNPSKILAT